MKHAKYIFAVLLCIFFSCEKEEYPNRSQEGNEDEYYIHPEDTAGVVVPEGYSLVVFPGNRTTKAVETRIQHLRYLIYQKDDAGNYLLIENTKVNRDLSTWPVTGIATSVPRNHEYKVVFLGNVDKSVFSGQTDDLLTGTGKNASYQNARILLPNVEFTDNNMYYLTQKAFDTNVTESESAVIVPVTLKRIVSRNDITKAGLSDAYAEGVTDDATYKNAYWKQLIKEKLVNDIFLNTNSTFRYQVAEGMKRYLIYPLIYVGLANPADANAQAANYSAIAQYNKEWETLYKPDKAYIGYLDNIHKKYSSHTINNYPNNIFIRYSQYLYDVFIENKDNVALKNMLSQIYNDNIEITEVGSVTTTQKSIDAAIGKVITAFNNTYTSGSLLPLRNLEYKRYSIVQTNTTLPGAVDFDLNPDVTLAESAGSKNYRIKTAPDNKSDNYISIVTLGEPQSSTNKLGISQIKSGQSGGTTIHEVQTVGEDIFNTPFEAGYFHRNKKTVTTQSITSASLAHPETVLNNSYQQKIEVSIYNLFYNQMKAKKVAGDIQIGDSYGIAVTTSLLVDDVRDIQYSVLNVLTSKYVDMSGDKTTMSFPFVTFVSPDISSANLQVTTGWTVNEVEK